MSDLYDDPDFIDALVNETLVEEDARRERIQAIATAISHVDDPLVRRILLALLELIQ